MLFSNIVSLIDIEDFELRVTLSFIVCSGDSLFKLQEVNKDRVIHLV